MLAQNVLFPGTPKALEYLSSLHCRYHWYWKEDHKEWDMKGRVEDLLVYNCWDNVRTFEVGQSLRRVVEQSGMSEQMKIKMQTNDWCLEMMNTGVLFDQKKKIAMSVELSDAIGQLQAELLYIVPQKLADPDYPQSKHDALFTKKGLPRKNGKYVYWPRSEKQTKYVLNELLGFPVIRKRGEDRATSGKEARQQWEKQLPQWGGLIRRLGLYESADNTLGVINSGLDHRGRMVCFFGPGGTETHRLNSSKNVFGGGTNLQNLTKGKEK